MDAPANGTKTRILLLVAVISGCGGDGPRQLPQSGRYSVSTTLRTDADPACNLMSAPPDFVLELPPDENGVALAGLSGSTDVAQLGVSVDGERVLLSGTLTIGIGRYVEYSGIELHWLDAPPLTYYQGQAKLDYYDDATGVHLACMGSLSLALTL